MSILKELGFIDPIDIVTLGGISDNPIDLVKRGLAYYQENENKKGDDDNQAGNKSDEKMDNFIRNEVSAL